jgi:uncharacterized protein YggE
MMSTLSKMAIGAIMFGAANAIVPAHVHADDGDEAGRITLSGTGTAQIPADMAVITLGVVEEAETARDALDANSKAMRDVLAAMRETGIEERDLQTSNFQISPRYEEKRKGSAYEQTIIGYEVRNALTVRIRDLSLLGTVLDRSVSLGVNDGGAVRFTNDDPSAALDEARVEAMEDAIAKARLLTETAGVGLGRILDISEQGNRPQPRSMARTEMAMSASADVPIASGENSYEVTVSVTWEIDQ